MIYLSEGTFLLFIYFNIAEQKVSLFCSPISSFVLSKSLTFLSSPFSSLIMVAFIFDTSTDRAGSCLLL